MHNTATIAQLTIKNMVCPRCVEAVKHIFKSIGITAVDVEIGHANIKQNFNTMQLAQLSQLLHNAGFELLHNQDEIWVERIKTIVMQLARKNDGEPVKLSQELAEALHIDYNRLSTFFSNHEHRTIEKFYIAHKIEYVKELLDYGELTVSEIAFKTGYSSVAHLSRQFKQVTGVAPTQYKQQQPSRLPLDKI